MKITNALERVLRVLLDDPDARHWGYDLMKTAGLKSGTLYPLLSRLQDEGYVESRWEEPTGDRPGPIRKYYVLTEDGQRFSRKVLATVSAGTAAVGPGRPSLGTAR
ncbi:PadR family transcriptional regulator [Kribbella sp. NPDC049174]|uniref:PadR family transcriptional regulator n=1 Tax=Kribbella sp. NPDC049174 TaxID=3364112 RepID=UPI003716DC3D